MKNDYRPAIAAVLNEQYPAEWRAGFAVRFGGPFNQWAAAVIILCRHIAGKERMDAFMRETHGEVWGM